MSFKAHYANADVAAAFAALGMTRGDVVYLSGNLGNLGFHASGNKTATLEGFVDALFEVIGEEGTVVVPTHSFSLCNTDRVFDPQATPSETGPLTEFVRTRPGAVRQFHPFASVTALGARAEEICAPGARQAYGPNTPFARLLEADAWGVSVGLPPNRTCSIVHHVEQMMAVPYRYTKEFLQPVRRPEGVVTEPFYLLVTRRDVDLVRDQNEKLFAHPRLAAGVGRAPLGMGGVAAYRLRTLVDAAVDLMSHDLYAWLRQPPVQRPFQS
jgi:aminoglycoside 3-N-acetyltransferase